MSIHLLIDVVFLLDIQLRFSYIQLNKKRVLIIRTISNHSYHSSQCISEI
jgi:hypothetical protein